jgi:hypothetical protein
MANLFFSSPIHAEEPAEHKVTMLEEKVVEYRNLAEERGKRLEKLEPLEPIDMEDPPWGEEVFPSKVLPIADIPDKKNKIPFRVIVDKPNYDRKAYKKLWHSTEGGGRLSYIPSRIHYALHRLFTNYDIGLSNWYSFELNMGFSIPMFQNEKNLDMYIVAFQTEVIDVYTKGNQVIVIGKPKRNGVQVITIKTRNIVPVNKEEPLLVQLATQAGNEIDYSLIYYAPPDFWLKQKEKLEKRKR